MQHLTKQEKTVLTVVLSLLLTGLAVKTYRTAHPPPPPDDGVSGKTGSGLTPADAAPKMRPPVE